MPPRATRGRPGASASRSPPAGRARRTSSRRSATRTWTRSRRVFVTGQVRTALRGTNAFQEADVIGITAPIVKHSIAVERPDDVAQAIADALHLRARRPARAGAGRRAGRRRERRPRAARRRTRRSCPATGRGRSRTGGRSGSPRRRSRPRGGRCCTRAAASCTPARRPS